MPNLLTSIENFAKLLRNMEEKLSDIQIVHTINSNYRWKKIWGKLSPTEKRQTLNEAEGDTWHIDQIMTQIIEDRA